MSAGRASVRPRLSRLCWVEVPCPEERLRRAVARDGEASRPMLEAWQRFERGWFAVDQTKRHADDVILPADGSYVGYTTHSAEPGEIVEIVRKAD